MEKLKASVPVELRRLILCTPSSDLRTTCAALDKQFSASRQFSQLLEQLVHVELTSCAKDAVGSANWKHEGNAAFGTQNYHRALCCYTKALQYVPLALNEENNMPQATLFLNRAAALHKLGLLESSLRDCNRAIGLNPSYSKAWYRRARVKSDIGDCHGALTDMDRALAIETTTGAQVQIKRELMQMEEICRATNSLQISPSSSHSKERPGFSGALFKITEVPEIQRVQKHWTKEKGWGLQAMEDLPMGSLVFQEDPYAAVLLKPHRDTRCHFCFELLPADPVTCSGCAIPLYCSELCRTQAAGSSRRLDTISNCKESDGCQRWGEHIPECGGASWSAVLPTEAVLGARMFFCLDCSENEILKRKLNLVRETGISVEVDTLCHHYDKLGSSDKLELHVLGVVLAHCLLRSVVPSGRADIKVDAVASKLIGLMARVRVNAMAVYNMSSPESIDITTNNATTRKAAVGNVHSASTSLSTVEQVNVAQGIFLVGSCLNHSCVPNVHASFVLGRLSIRAITSIRQGSVLELCYGPQVGEQSQLERKNQLLERYFFTCSCSSCSKLTLPDLFLRSFRCAKRDCMGVVLGPESLEALVNVEGAVKSDVNGDGFDKEKGSQHMIEQSVAAIDPGLLDDEFAKSNLACEKKIGRCLVCGMVVDIQRTYEVVRNAATHLDRVEAKLIRADINAKDVSGVLKSALNALNNLRSTIHAYSRQLAKGEDIVARLLCAVDQPHAALSHCRRSIAILEQLYNKQHIVVSNEHVKLATIALMASDVDSARDSLAIVGQIFSVYYGSDYQSRISYIGRLQEMVLYI